MQAMLQQMGMADDPNIQEQLKEMMNDPNAMDQVNEMMNDPEQMAQMQAMAQGKKGAKATMKEAMMNPDIFGQEKPTKNTTNDFEVEEIEDEEEDDADIDAE